MNNTKPSKHKMIKYFYFKKRFFFEVIFNILPKK